LRGMFQEYENEQPGIAYKDLLQAIITIQVILENNRLRSYKIQSNKVTIL
jgi:hypothetical protein